MPQEIFLTPQQCLEHAVGYENGIVNFRMLYTLLNILISNIAGMDTCRIKLNTDENGTSLKEKVFDNNNTVPSEFSAEQVCKKYKNVTKEPSNTLNDNSEATSSLTTSSNHITYEIKLVECTSKQNIGNHHIIKSGSTNSMETIKKDSYKDKHFWEVMKEETDKKNVDEKKHSSENEYYDRLIEMENSIKTLTLSVNDVSKKINLIETTVDSFTENEEIDRIKSELEEIKKNCLEVLNTKTKEQKNLNNIEKTPTANVKMNSTSVSSQNMVQLFDLLIIDITKLKNDLQQVQFKESNKISTIDDSRLKNIETKLLALENAFDSLNLKKYNSNQSFSYIDYGLNDVQTNINTIKNELQKLEDLSGFLLSEKNTVTKTLEQLSTQIESIKEDKANKEEVRAALKDKVDSIKNKVSLEEFMLTKRDMTNSIKELIKTLSVKEQAWKNIIQKIQQLLDSKLEQHDIQPLKSYMQTHVDNLQIQLKALESIIQETEAAGTRVKLLRNLNCLSCDSVTNMRNIETCPGLPKLDSLPSVVSLKPYLTYKLHEIKQEQLRHNSIGHHFYALKPMGGAIYDQNYLCNRYCGGHHTNISLNDCIKSTFLRPCYFNNK